MTSQKFYHIRLTADIENIRYAQYARERTTSHVLVRENADEDCKQTHLHCHFTSLHKNDQALRREFKSWFSALSGNKDYSLKEGNEIGFRYVCKGTSPEWETGKPAVLSTTFSEDEIKEFHRLYWSHQTRVIVPMAETPEPFKKKRERKLTWTEEIIEELTIAHPNRRFEKDFPGDVRFLTTYILKKMGSRGRALDDIIFRRIFYAVYNGLKKTNEGDENFITHYEHLITKQW